MKILVLNPPFIPRFSRGMRWQETSRGGALYYPVWLAYATGVLEREFETRLVDAPAWNWDLKKTAEFAEKYSPRLIVMDSSTPSFANDVKIAEELKARLPNCKIIFVGAHVSAMPEETLGASSAIDAVARKEYDYTLLEAAKRVEAGKGFEGVLGLSCKAGKKVLHNADRPPIENLDELPFVSQVYKKHLRPKDYFLSITLHPMVQIMTSRGCPNACNFCLWPQTLMGRKLRQRSVKNVLDEVEFIKRELPEVKEIFFEDDTLTVDKKRTEELCGEIMRRKLDFTWSANARADLAAPLLKKMKKAGCRLLVAGYESGSAEVLKAVKKGLGLEQMREFAKAAREAGLLVHGCFVFGLKGDSKESLDQTMRFALELKPDIAQFSVATPFPGTEFYDWCRQNGFLSAKSFEDYLDAGGHQKCVVSYPTLSSSEISRRVDFALKQYYLSPSYFLVAARQISGKHGFEEFKRLFNSAKAFAKYLKSKSEHNK